MMGVLWVRRDPLGDSYRCESQVGGTFVETSWGRDGHTGPVYPRGTRICVQFKGLSTKACVTLK
ncbi:hypothetical protein D7Y56_00250 (plasmid) [Streptomyces sp. S501]|nr:hypothetical protein D7Y56_00250 [Streptomyces sp. S501]